MFLVFFAGSAPFVKDQAIRVLPYITLSLVFEESDDVPSSAFIHGYDHDMIEHGDVCTNISPTTTCDDLSDFSHHIESESDFTTSPIYDVFPLFPCEQSHNPHLLSGMSDSTICEFECTYFEGVSEPPHRESEIVDRSCEATLLTT